MTRTKKTPKKPTRPSQAKSGQNAKKKQGATGREKITITETRPPKKHKATIDSVVEVEIAYQNAHHSAPGNPPRPPDPPKVEPPTKAPGSIAVAEAQIREATKRGRPPELTPEVHAAMMLARSMGQPEVRIGPLIGLDRSIVGKWKERGLESSKKWANLTEDQQLLERPYIDFFDGLRAAMPKFELSCLAIMVAAKNAGDARIADRLLQMQFPEYRTTRVAVVGGDPDDPPVATQDAGPMPEAERMARAKKARDLLAAMEDGG